MDPRYEVCFFLKFVCILSLEFLYFMIIFFSRKDIRCEFKIFNDDTVHKTNSIKRVADKFDCNFSKQFSFTATPEVSFKEKSIYFVIY